MDFNEENIIQEEVTKAKKGSGKKILIFGTIVVAVLLLLGVTKVAAMENAVVKLFTSPAGYYQYVEEKNAGQMAKTLASVYSELFRENINISDRNTKAGMNVKLDSDVIDLVGSFLYRDVEFLENFGVTMEVNGKDEVFQNKLGIKSQGEELVTGEVILNLENEMFYAQIPQMSKKYLSAQIDTLQEQFGLSVSAEDCKEGLKQLKKIYEVLPEEEQVENLLTKYIGLALSCVEEVEEEKTVLTVNDVSMKCTKLEAVLTEETMQEMTKLLLEHLLEDKEVRSIVEDVLTALVIKDAEEIYDEFMEEISWLLENVEDIQLDEELEITLWVDKNGIICGRKIEYDTEYDGTYEASYVVAKDGKNVGIEIEGEVDNVKVRLDGTATIKNKKLNGELNVKAAGLKLANIILSELEIGKESLEGSFYVELEDAIVDLVEEEIGGLPIDISDAGLKFDISSEKEKSSLGFALLVDEDALVQVDTSVQFADGESVSMPKSKNCILVEDVDDIEDYVETVSEDEFIEELEDAGVPIELVGAIEEFFALFD